MEGGSGICLRKDQVFCRVESQMVIFDFEGEGDWNRACCHSNKKSTRRAKIACFQCPPIIEPSLFC